jgi:cholesterol oxidase
MGARGAADGGGLSRIRPDRNGRVFGRHNLIVCAGAVAPANPGVNPCLTIAALGEHVVTTVPAAAATAA